MKLLLTLINWEYPADGRIPELLLIDESSTTNQLMGLYLLFANGCVVEMRAEGDSDEALDVVRGLALGAGSGRLVAMIPAEDRRRLWLYKEAHECYMQGSAYIFVNPVPQPDRFEA